MCYSGRCKFELYNGDCNFPTKGIIKNKYPNFLCPIDYYNYDDYLLEVDKINQLMDREAKLTKLIGIEKVEAHLRLKKIKRVNNLIDK